MAEPVAGVAELVEEEKTLVEEPSSTMVTVPEAAEVLVTVPVMEPVEMEKDSEPS